MDRVGLGPWAQDSDSDSTGSGFTEVHPPCETHGLEEGFPVEGAEVWGLGEAQRWLGDRVHCVSGLHTRGLCLILTLLQEAGVSVLQMKPLELREGTSDVKGHTASGCRRQD